MLTIDKLLRFGTKVDEGLSRCVNDEAFYFRMISMAVEDTAFEELDQALAAEDLDAAFAAVHKLKGVLGNLALEPLYRPASELTELLRHKSPGDYRGLLNTILEQRAALRALIED